MNMIDHVLYGDEPDTPRPPEGWNPSSLVTTALSAVGFGLALASVPLPLARTALDSLKERFHHI